MDVNPCPHCGTPVEGAAGTYCCTGCEMAAEIVRGAGLEAYYEKREQPAPRARKENAARWSKVPVVAAQGGVRADLAIDGMRCASCVWVTESVLERTPGVLDARVSYASGRAAIVFDPSLVELPDLAQTIATLGYTPRPATEQAPSDSDLLTRLGVATFCAANVMGLSIPLYLGWAQEMDPRYAALFRWGALLIATPAVTWSAVPFFRGAWRGIQARVADMDLPISLAILLMYGHGLWATRVGAEGYLDSLTMLIALLLGGRVLEARGRRRVTEAATQLAAHLPATAKVVRGDAIEVVSANELAIGDRVDVGMGEEIPVDGVIHEGQASVRMAVLTGESEPVQLGPGDHVVAGAMVIDGAIQLGVTRTGADTVLQRMADQLAAAPTRSKGRDLASRIAPAFTVATLGLAALTGGLGLVLGWDDTLSRVVAVLVVACPCALSLATPLCRAAAMGALARRGVLLRDGSVLEELAQTSVVAFDKTGTLTEGVPRVVRAEREALRVAAGLERFSAHPVAQAIVGAAVQAGIPVPMGRDVREAPAQGIEGVVDDVHWRLRAGGPGEVVLTSDAVEWVIELEDRPRAEAADAVAGLKREGLRVALLSGDRAEVATRIGAAVGVETALGDLQPADKVAWIAERRAQEQRVLFLGDGINDGLALVEADVGLAMASGAPSSMLAADGVVISGGLAALPFAVRMSDLAGRRIRTNLVRSAVYNVLAVGLAMIGWVNPLVAAIWMPISSAVVVASAAALGRKEA